MQTLHSETPENAVERFLNSRIADNGISEKTVRNNRYNLKKFRTWANETGFGDMSEIDGLRADDFRTWVMESDLRPMTRQNIVTTFRTFLRYCENLEMVHEGVSEKILPPSVNDEDEVRDGRLSTETAHEILNYLRRFQYGSLRHVLFEVFWHTGMRKGSARSLDVDDWQPQNHALSLKHRPDTDTPLKNGTGGERHVYINDERVVDTINDYIEHTRPTVTDEYGREPLFATTSGRLHESGFNYNTYVMTRPCYYANADCECDAGCRNEEASKCDHSISPHDIRKSSVTAQLNADIPQEVVQDRVDMSKEIMDKHYDQRSEGEKMNVRKDYLNDF